MCLMPANKPSGLFRARRQQCGTVILQIMWIKTGAESEMHACVRIWNAKRLCMSFCALKCSIMATTKSRVSVYPPSSLPAMIGTDFELCRIDSVLKMPCMMRASPCR